MPETYETLLLEKRERVAIITINRPDKRNALNIKTREEGAALLEELRNDSSVGVVVFTGAGDKAFIAGADIGEFAGRTSITQRDVMMGRSLFTAIDSFPKPVIAMINGYCLGGGCELALACDIRVASETASFGQPEINLVNHVVPADQLQTKTLELASRIAEKSPIALQLAKEAVKLASRSNLDE